ncbi:MAG: DUF1326 domain-containing protein [Actinobacteria bacterium]|nr:DUF1326 domain-containing protein [Actinomycetota bacterium]
MDLKPSSDEGECYGAVAMGIKQGDLDGTDLSGISFALYNHFESNPSAGNWGMRVVIDETASEDQAKALERILSGEEGGAFGDLSALISDVTMARGQVSVSNGDSASASVEGSEIRFEPFRGPDGSPTKMSSAMFGFAPEFMVGKASGRYSSFGQEFEAKYGESGDFEFSSESADVKGRI